MTERITANDVLRFLLELAALVALGVWGFGTRLAMPWSVVLGIGAPLLMALLWGAFLSPKARYRLSAGSKLLLEVLIFTGAAAALLASDRTTWAAVFAGLVVIHELVRWSQQRPGAE